MYRKALRFGKASGLGMLVRLGMLQYLIGFNRLTIFGKAWPIKQARGPERQGRGPYHKCNTYFIFVRGFNTTVTALVLTK